MSDTTSSLGKRALIVDDDTECADLLKMILEDENWRVECVKSGSQALRVLTDRLIGEVGNFDSDVMLLDLKLADMSGVDVIERLQNWGVKIPPTVIITAASTRTLNQALARVMAVGIRKPFDSEELFLAISAALTQTRTPSARNRGPEIHR